MSGTADAPPNAPDVPEEVSSNAGRGHIAWVALAMVVVFAAVGLWERPGGPPASAPPENVGAASPSLAAGGLSMASTTANAEAGALAELLAFERLDSDPVALTPEGFRAAVLGQFTGPASSTAGEDWVAIRLGATQRCRQRRNTGGTCVLQSNVLSTRVDAAPGGAATIVVWFVEISSMSASSSAPAAAATWWTDTAQLQLAPSVGWRLTGITRSAGPVPLSPGGA